MHIMSFYITIYNIYAYAQIKLVLNIIIRKSHRRWWCCLLRCLRMLSSPWWLENAAKMDWTLSMFCASVALIEVAINQAYKKGNPVTVNKWRMECNIYIYIWVISLLTIAKILSIRNEWDSITYDQSWNITGIREDEYIWLYWWVSC